VKILLLSENLPPNNLASRAWAFPYRFLFPFLSKKYRLCLVKEKLLLVKESGKST